MAKKFDFKLQSVLNLRTHKVEQAKDQLNSAIRSRVEKELTISEYLTYRNELFMQKPISCKAADIQAKLFHIDHIDSEIHKLEKEKVRIKEIEQVRRGHLSNAMKSEKVLTKLKDKKLSYHKYELEKEDTKVLDEIAMQKNDFNDNRLI